MSTQRVTGGKHAHPFAPECGTHPDMKLSLSLAHHQVTLKALKLPSSGKKGEW